MDKKLRVLRNLLRRYRTPCKSTLSQCFAYDDMREILVQAGCWSEWCAAKQYAFDHRAYDHFA
ncbi:MAG: hypothetical protein Q7S87_03225 [Agitococcus sp.]|nr:hypothetical protein [Agitococcus sp.]MDO9178648.1 hypothetical protein [Agitococcus sp.]